MTVRPNIDDVLIEDLNEKTDGLLRVDPSAVGVGQRLEVLLEEYEAVKERNKELEEEIEELKEGIGEQEPVKFSL